MFFLWGVATTFLRLVFIHSVPSSAAAVRTFALTFCICGTIFITLLYELTGLLSPDEATTTLSAAILMLLGQAIIFLPALVLQSLVLASGAIKSQKVSVIVSAACLTGLWLLAGALLHPCSARGYGETSREMISSLSNPIVLGQLSAAPKLAAKDSSVEEDGEGGSDAVPVSDETAEYCLSFFSATLARVGVIGAVFVSALGGFASVATPAAYLGPLLMFRSNLWEQTLDSLQRRQRAMINRLASKRRALADAQMLLYTKRGEQGSKGSEQGGGLFGILSSTMVQMTGGFSASNLQRKIDMLELECESFGLVSLDIFLQTEEVAERARMAAAVKTWKGPFLASHGIILGLFSTFKFCATVWNLFRGSFSMVDPVTNGLTTAAKWAPWLPDFLLSYLPGSPTVEAMAGQIAFLFNMIIIVSALRGFLLLVFRLTCRNSMTLSPESLLLVFAWFMSLYFLGMSLLLRKSLPERSRLSLITAVGGREVPSAHYHWVHDVCFALFVCGTTVVKRVQWVNARRENESDHLLTVG